LRWRLILVKKIQTIKYDPSRAFETVGLSVAMGNFDGVHRGHKSVIEMARPADNIKKFGVLTFNPHPREFFSPSKKNFKIMSSAAKIHELEKLNVDVLIEIPFTKDLSSLDAETFAKTILSESLKLNHVVVGKDFRFGYERLGTTEALISYGKKYGFNVSIAPIISSNDLEVSSTAIRQYLSDGDIENAAKMLGHWYYFVGKVIKGDQRGRKLGFPTINLPVDNLHLPKFGVYTAVAEVLSGKYKGKHKAVVSIGERPTFGFNKANLEAHLLDFSGNLYGTDVSIELRKFQRPELKFESEKALISQMRDDCLIARELLA
jgi:riboflavin kinase/FMN adenylyltransferase